MAYKLTTKKTWSETVKDLETTFDKWGVGEAWKIDPWKAPKSRAAFQMPNNRLVKLTFSLSGREIVLSTNEQNRAVDNLRALYLAVERMRMIEVAGVQDLVRAAYAQLPAPPDPNDPYAVLGVPRNWDVQAIEAYWRNLMKTVHPDTAGDAGSGIQAQRYNAAMAAIRKERK
jgi:hypothetical protein